MGAAPALADPIGDAAKKPSEKADPFMKEVKWDSYIYNVKPGGSASAGDRATAIDRLGPIAINHDWLDLNTSTHRCSQPSQVERQRRNILKICPKNFCLFFSRVSI